MSDANIFKNELKKLIAETFKVTEDALSEDTRISSDLGADSLSILKLISRIEDRFKIDIDQNHIDLLDNLGTAYKYIRALIEEKNEKSL